MDKIRFIDGKHRAMVLIRVENAGFDMIGKLLGNDGQNMIYIEKCSGVQMCLAGVGADFMGLPPTTGPLHVTIKHSLKESVERALPLVQHLVNTVHKAYKKYVTDLCEQDPNVENRIKETHPYFKVLPVDVQPTSEFKLFDLLLGSDGTNLEYIAQSTNAMVFVDGEAALHVNPIANSGPVRIVVRHATKEGVDEAVPMVESLIEVMHEEYESYLEEFVKSVDKIAVHNIDTYCAICKVQCSCKEDYIKHKRSAKHYQNKLAADSRAKENPAAIASAASQQSEVPPAFQMEPHEHVSYQREFFSRLISSQCDVTLRSRLQDRCKFGGMTPEEQEYFKKNTGKNNYCLVCDEQMKDGYNNKCHWTQKDHRLEYVKLQLRYGPTLFRQFFGGVSIPGMFTNRGLMLAADSYEYRFVPQDVAHLKTQNIEKYAYQELILLSGVASGFTCKVCDVTLNRSMMQQWIFHIQGKPHAKACIECLQQKGPYCYLEQYGDVPAPIRSKVQDVIKDKPQPATLENVALMVPDMTVTMWDNISSLAEQERAQKRHKRRRLLAMQEKHEQKHESYDNDDDHLIAQLKRITKVRDPEVLEQCVRHLQARDADIAYITELLDSDEIKDMLSGKTKFSKNQSAVKHNMYKLKNFTCYTAAKHVKHHKKK